MNTLIIVIILAIFLLVNFYIIYMQKKQIYIKQKMVDENKVEKYLLYMSSIIENKEREIEELNLLKLDSPDDKNIDLLLSQKEQEKEAVSEELTNYVSEHTDSLKALKTERNYLLDENRKLNEKIDRLNAIIREGSGDESEWKDKYKKLKEKYNKMEKDYKQAKTKIEELDEEFTKLYD